MPPRSSGCGAAPSEARLIGWLAVPSARRVPATYITPLPLWSSSVVPGVIVSRLPPLTPMPPSAMNGCPIAAPSSVPSCDAHPPLTTTPFWPFPENVRLRYAADIPASCWRIAAPPLSLTSTLSNVG